MTRTGVPVLAPEVAARLLNYEVGRLLAERSVTHGEIANRLGVSRASVSQAIGGRALLSRAALEVVLDHVDATDRLPRLLLLHKQARRGTRASSPGDRDLVVGLEAYATCVEVYDAAEVCGLLLDERRRQVLGAGTRVQWVLEEHVVRRVLSTTQREQVRRVLALPTVTVQIVPWLADPHPGRLGGFEIVHGPAGVVVCEEGRLATSYHDSADVVADFRALFSRLCAVAAGPELSRSLLSTRETLSIQDSQ